MTNIDYEKMWDEIIETVKSGTTLLEGEKTVKMFAEEAEMKIETARTLLDRWVKEGKMQVRTVQQGKIRFNAYSPIDTAK